MQAPADADDSDLVVARWAAGEPHEVPGLTVGKLRELSGSRRSHDDFAGTLWSGTQASTTHKVTVQQRPDRVLLLSIYEQQRQVLQFRMDLFGPVEGTKPLPRGHNTLVRAMAVVTPIAEKFCTGALSRSELKGARADALAEAGIEKKSRGPTAKAKQDKKGEAEKAKKVKEKGEAEKAKEVKEKGEAENGEKDKKGEAKKVKEKRGAEKAKEKGEAKNKAKGSSRGGETIAKDQQRGARASGSEPGGGEKPEPASSSSGTHQPLKAPPLQLFGAEWTD